jgi:hypothetical protein
MSALYPEGFLEEKGRIGQEGRDTISTRARHKITKSDGSR